MVNSPRQESYLIPEKILTPDKSSNGYHRVTLFINGKRKKLLVSRISATAFIPNPLNLPEVNHKFGNLDDNRPISLEWVTKQQNSDHKWKYLIDRKSFAEKLRNSGRAKKIGDSHRGAKSVSAIPVIHISTGKVYECIRQAAKEHGIAKSTVMYQLKRNRNWAKA